MDAWSSDSMCCVESSWDELDDSRRSRLRSILRPDRSCMWLLLPSSPVVSCRRRRLRVTRGSGVGGRRKVSVSSGVGGRWNVSAGGGPATGVGRVRGWNSSTAWDSGSGWMLLSINGSDGWTLSAGLGAGEVGRWTSTGVRSSSDSSDGIGCVMSTLPCPPLPGGLGIGEGACDDVGDPSLSCRCLSLSRVGV